MLEYHAFLVIIFLTTVVLSETLKSNLVVIDSKSKQEVSQYLIKNTDEPLDLVCKVRILREDQISLSWIHPFNEQNVTIEDEDEPFNISTIVRFEDEAENGTVRLFVNSLQTAHSGSYVCEWITNSSGTVRQTVKLIVKPRKVFCGKKFECGDNQCISIIYKCDGVADCKNKSDEAPELCGINPCDGRVMCSNGRCIPTEWCKVCDPLKSNCTNRHRHDCCPSLEAIAFHKGLLPYSDGSYFRRFNDFPESPSMQHQYDINFIHTTIYTIIGCSLVFMVIVTILVIAICRVHLKRSQPAHLPNNRRVFSTTAYHRAFTQEIGVYDVDITMNQRADRPGLLVTYNINNGVQIVGSPIDPPPYSEVASLPPREGPPPPYALSQLRLPGNVMGMTPSAMYSYFERQEYALLGQKLSFVADGSESRNVRSVECETCPKPSDRPLRQGLSPNARVSSEPSLPNLHRL